MLEHPNDQRLLVATLDHCGIVVFDPEEDRMLFEIPLKNQAIKSITGKFKSIF